MVFFSLLAAVVPTIFLVWMIWWADRYEREPVRLLVAAFVWGAVPAIILSLIAELIAGVPFSSEGLGDALVQSAAIAPVVEELVKGLALLGLIRFSRAEIDGTLDGIVYGALVGAGFAMTENFLYFLSAQENGWAMIVFLRAFIFGLNHIFFTAIFGASVGYALTLRNKSTRRIIILLGWGLAIAVHAFHNFAVTLSGIYPGMFFASVIMNWGGALVMLFIVIGSLHRERSAILAYLSSDDAPALPPEVEKQMLSILPPKDRLLPDLPWLSQRRHTKNKLYQSVAELALRRQRLGGTQDDERMQLVAEMARLQKTIDELNTAISQDERPVL